MLIFTHVPHESCPSCAIEQLDVYEAQSTAPAGENDCSIQP